MKPLRKTGVQRNNLVIVPTYNEQANIEPLVKKILASHRDVDILFVDDNSSDGTPATINDLSRQNPGRITLLSRPKKLGLGSAYLAGFKKGLDEGYKTLIEMDADLSHDPKYLPHFIVLLDSHDFVVGSRYIQGGGIKNWSLLRRLISRAGSLFARGVLRIELQDFTGGYNAWNRRTLERIGLKDVTSDGYVFQIELKYRAILAGCTFKETPIVFSDRTSGESKMSLAIVLEAVWRVFTLPFIKVSSESHDRFPR